jgi:hypothetical protein
MKSEQKTNLQKKTFILLKIKIPLCCHRWKPIFKEKFDGNQLFSQKI